MIKIVKEYIGFHYLLIEIQLYTLVLLELNIFLKKYYKFKDKSITHNIFRIQDNESIMCGCYCITFVEYILAGITLLNSTNLFFPNDHKKNDKIIYKYFKDK